MHEFTYRMRNFFKKIGRIISGTIDAFSQNQDYLKASALTYYTLISIVPFLAVALGIASGFGFAQFLEENLKNAFEEQPEVVNYAIQFARSMLKNTQGSVIAGVGIIALLWTNISMLSSIENALNDMWKVKQPRSWTKKFSDYLTAMILAPIFVVASSSLSVFLITQITATAKENPWIEVVSPFLLFMFKLIPFVLSILLFIVIYLFIPNTQKNAQPRIFAGILAGIAFQFWQWLYIKFQVYLSSYNVVYGTFAALPLFLLWLQISWLILLAGAELAAHIENEMSQPANINPDSLGYASDKEIGLLILHKCIEAYTNGHPPLTTLQIARILGTPLLDTQQMIDILEEKGILVEVGLYGSSKIGYQPSRDARLYTVLGVVQAIESRPEWLMEAANSPVFKRISDCLRELEKVTEGSPANLTMQQIIEKVSETN